MVPLTAKDTREDARGLGLAEQERRAEDGHYSLKRDDDGHRDRRVAQPEEASNTTERSKISGSGVKIVTCLLPKKSPWLNAIEPKWVHGKRKVVEPDGLLGAHELAERVCAAFGCPHYEHLSVAENVA
jgi:hypothetical protein